MIRLAVVADDQSDDWCSRLAAHFSDVNIERVLLDVSADFAASRHAISTQLQPFDAVWVFPGRLAHELCSLVAEAGKHLLVDLRTVPEIKDLDALQDAVIAGGGLFVIGNTLRYFPSVQVVKQQLDADKLGEPGLLRIHYWDAASYSYQIGPSHPLAVEFVGVVDLACWLFGGAPTHVYAKTHSTQAASQSPNYIQLHLGFPGGMALLDNWRDAHAGPGYFSLSLIGANGAAYADDHHDMQLLLQNGLTTALRSQQEHFAANTQVEDFLAAIVEQRAPSNSFEQAKRLAKIAVDVTESLESDQPVLLGQ